MEPSVFDELQQTLATHGPAAAIDRLCARLREQKDYGNLFYALLMKKRHELGVSPIPTAPSHELPAAAHAAYEGAIREAGRTATRLYLDEGNIPQAWAYARLIGEPEPVKAALEQYQPAGEEDVQPLVQIAFYEGAHPRKGFDWILKHFGICNAITTMGGHGGMGGQEFPFGADVQEYCTKRLVRALYQELYDRLTAEVLRNEGKAAAAENAQPATKGMIQRLMTDHPELFEGEFYHVDTSHLAAVVQMSVNLPPCEELEMAGELCAYGQRLERRFQIQGDHPFEDQYHDYGIYLATLAGQDVERGVAHFREKAETADKDIAGTFPAEVLVNLLLRLDRPAEALAVAQKHLTGTNNQQLKCPGIGELCQRAKAYETLADLARQQGDAVHFVAGLIAAGTK